MDIGLNRPVVPGGPDCLNRTPDPQHRKMLDFEHPSICFTLINGRVEETFSTFLSRFCRLTASLASGVRRFLFVKYAERKEAPNREMIKLARF